MVMLLCCEILNVDLVFPNMISVMLFRHFYFRAIACLFGIQINIEKTIDVEWAVLQVRICFRLLVRHQNKDMQLNIMMNME